MPRLHVHLDAALPDALTAGGATALFVAGWCHVKGRRVARLRVEAGGKPQPVAAERMPRLDVLRALGDPPAYRSGFWATVRLGPCTAGATVELDLVADLEGGGTARAALGRLPVLAPPEPVAVPPGVAGGDGPLVAICLAAHEPPPDLLRRQLDSIRSQTHRRWVCVISDDASSPAGVAALEEAIGGDERFVLSRSPARLGFFRNFERALALAPREATHVALADQDDAWHPDKLEVLLGALGDARLAFSDARLVDRDGRVTAETYWSERRNEHRDLRALLVANSVTGAASLVPRDLLDVALPFPPAQFAHFHDHWLALCALATGDIAYVDRPLYDYTQHGGAVLGHAAANRVTALRDRLGTLRSDPRGRIRLYRATYFVDAARLTQAATMLLDRCGPRMAPRKRRALEGFLAADTSLAAAARLWLRGVRDAAGRPATLGAERGLAYAFAWRRLVAATARDVPQRLLRLDAVPPADLAPRPGHRSGPEGAARDVAEKIAPLRLAVSDGAPPRINLLLPTIDLDHLFGGYIGKLNLARRLAERGARVRIVTVDPVPPLPADWRRRVAGYEGLGDLFDRVEVAFGRETPGGIEVSRDDRFVATTWWTAHVAADAVRRLGGGRFLYLVQEYEPYTFPMGTWAALAEQSYRFEHAALFSTELLQEHFRRQGIGVYAGGRAAGDAASAAFRNAITPVAPPPASELQTRRSRRLLFYARPEPHAARNLFELGVLALGRAAELGAFRDGWELRGVGTTALGRRLPLGGGAVLDLLPRTDQTAWARTLPEHDVGLALMHTPHPSLVPIEMASAGLLTVTSAFAHKTPEALRAISANLLAAEPTVEAVARAIAEAVAGAGDTGRRLAGAAVDWPRDWDGAFGEGLMARLEALLDP